VSFIPLFLSLTLSLINLDYYNPRLHMCQPEGGPQSRSEGLGSVLFGDRIYSGPIHPKMMSNESCVLVCTQTIPAADAKFINEKINEQYAVKWMVDGLPVATKKIADRSRETFYSIGFPLGQKYDVHNLPLDRPALNNHHDIYIEYHERKPNEYRVVGATVYPSSVDSLWGGAGKGPDCAAPTQMILSEDGQTTVAYTYTARWVPSKTPWATRWDNYLRVFDPRIHWFAIINSLIIVALLMLVVRTGQGRNVLQC
jgi:transmembrane 9 superfamily member 2/4